MSGVAATGGDRRITYLTHHPPWPPANGGAVRESNLLRQLSGRFAVDVLAVCRPGTTTAPIAVRRAVGASTVRFFTDRSRQGLRRERWSDGAAQAVAALGRLGSPAPVVHVEGGYLFPHVPATLHDRTCVVEHNIESQVLRHFAAITGDPALVRAVARVEQLEDRAWRGAAKVVAVTEEDRVRIAERSGRLDVALVPNGADHVALATVRPAGESATALLFANWAYAPNADALVFALDDVWPAILAAMPEARLIVAGSGLTADQRARARQAEGVEVVGFVDDPSALFGRTAMMLCPLRVGGGVKVKVLEALRHACPVVTTPVGAQGIVGAARDALTVASTAGQLAAATTKLLLDPVMRARGSAEARCGGASLPTWSDAAGELAEIWAAIGAPRVAA